jgi:hypothetical protein
MDRVHYQSCCPRIPRGLFPGRFYFEASANSRCCSARLRNFCHSGSGCAAIGGRELQSTQILIDGSTNVRKSFANIARDSQGRIYNERRQLVNPSFTGTPQIVSFHIFDPNTRLNTFLDPSTHLARQSTWHPPESTAEQTAGSSVSARDPLVQEKDLGTEIMDGLSVHGTLKTRMVPAAVSGTGRDVVVTDEIWYSDELHLNMLEKRDDPRTGKQTLTVTRVDRSEPNHAMFEVPADYKVVDENPEN